MGHHPAPHAQDLTVRLRSVIRKREYEVPLRRRSHILLDDLGPEAEDLGIAGIHQNADPARIEERIE